jgi:hypothetical protein
MRSRASQSPRRSSPHPLLALASPAALALWLCAACGKVPLTNVNAGFVLADAAWFADEETLFVFYRLDAEQGLGPESQIEVAYNTDQQAVSWTPIAALTPVHPHVPVDCGATSLCGSTSLHVPIEPRHVGVRLRYHRDGETTLDGKVTFNAVGPGPAHSHRSLLVYGVFDETNTRVQWRARHQFPTLRNEQVEQLGLRRPFRIAGRQHGEAGPQAPGNPYSYAFASTCPQAMQPLEGAPLETSDRAAFDAQELPLSAATSPAVCARSTTTDARGTFDALALARKNPETRAAFPSLRSPVHRNAAVPFLLEPCDRTISEQHLAMQKQRLLLTDPTEVCIDGWRDPGFADRLAAAFREKIDLVRAAGSDMVLVIALHHDDSSGELAAKLELALAQILPLERDKSSPRASGAFVFDSFGRDLALPALKNLVLWCPAQPQPDDLDQIPTNAQRGCPVLPDSPEFSLGPFEFSNLPILPTRAQYLRFVAKYSERQAGAVRELTFSAPERTPLSQNLRMGDFGVATFFNNEILTAAPGDAFSYCASDASRLSAAVFRSASQPLPMPLVGLPANHARAPEPTYALGLLWDFPFLLRMTHELVVAGSLTAFSFTVPFGISSPSEAYYGTELWNGSELSLRDTLLQCTRFCDDPTFDSAGVYNVVAQFRGSYANQCYRPRFPAPSDGGFPLDP